MNRDLTQVSATLEKRNQELDEFAYVASHDLRAPLRAISNLADWLQEDLADQIPPENKEQLDLMQSRVKRMDGFIQGLLEYSRAGRQNLETTPVDVGMLVSEVIDSLSPPPEFCITVSDSLPTIDTQKLLLQQVLLNLISNAIKYHDRPDGHVDILVKDQDDFVEFSIADDGPGIDPEYQERIFGIFQTLNSRDSVESTGIGLSIVKKLVEQQSGSISVQSALGEGSTFRFTWSKGRK
jgi:signal transduction histidine kinase